MQFRYEFKRIPGNVSSNKHIFPTLGHLGIDIVEVYSAELDGHWPICPAKKPMQPSKFTLVGHSVPDNGSKNNLQLYPGNMISIQPKYYHPRT